MAYRDCLHILTATRSTRVEVQEAKLGATQTRENRDCSEGYQLNLPSGVYKIQPSLATSPFSVYCKNVWGGRMFIAIRLEPDLLFNRTWEEYRNGFGNVAGDYWLGLQNIYLLTNSGLNYKLYVQMKDKADFFRQQIYFSFKISDETSSYRLYFNSTEPNAGPQRVLGDSLSPALGSRFSTYDADHDGDVTENCALRHQSGWWFPSPCNLTEGNPLGRLVRPSDEVWSGNSEDIFWLNDLGNKAPYKVEMWLVRL
ncbi:angiopoietin-related protein 1-like [Littorina saxatilis]|uniref:angiopoietin-related protein 1-like n=1 Tax=Littorina saxatilis TaxID=31220 RepID=UPI0038B490B7